ncbi:enoyl-CoA hydratase/isomerase family protein [Nocardioidaceae bacterium]|nr:enoyl-CoA hydratase/isomerase family protein [Nocardioidaceae bacterium]
MSTTTEKQSSVRVEIGEDGVAVLTLDDPNASANTMNDLYRESMRAAVDELEAAGDAVKGIVITSAKKTFFAGGDLKGMMRTTPADAEAVFEQVEGMKADLRRLEKMPVPVAAAINGAALGGGLEIALACNRRFCLDSSSVQIGLPEVTLGLLPGGGGVTRTVRMFGLSDALMGVLLQGPRMKPAQALEKGLVDELVGSLDELVPAARAWVIANAGNEDAAMQPWDKPGYKMPGGTPSNPKLAQFLPAFPANLRKQLKGANYPAPRAIMSAAIEGAQVDFDTASRIESRYLAGLITGPNAKNMIQAFFFDLQAINSGALRPEGYDVYKPAKVGVLGAGMMGAGIAYSFARSGIEVVLRDVSIESAERGKAYSTKILDKAVSRGKMTEEAKGEVLARITATDSVADLAGCDTIVEAVFEDPSLKHKVFAEVLEVVGSDALICSNTSTLPITELATGVDRPEDFVGLHFFSPVDKMPLVEIIRGEKTSDATTAKALDLVMLLKKTPIVVNDSRGFYTSRVIGTMVNEGLAMLAEGVAPMSIERAATQAGYPVGPLQLSDELNMELMAKIGKANRDAVEREGGEYTPHAAESVISKMIELERSSRLKGAGFYDYDEDGRRAGLWSGVTEEFPTAERQVPFADLKERLLVIEAVETARCFAEGVIQSAAAANIGSIFGIGYPALTGGCVQYMEGHEGGLQGFVARANELADQYGERFRPPSDLVERAEAGRTYRD